MNCGELLVLCPNSGDRAGIDASTAAPFAVTGAQVGNAASACSRCGPVMVDKEAPHTRSGGAEFRNTNHLRALRAFLRPFAFGEGVAPAIRKSSIFLPVLIAAANHRGFNPRPAQVSLGF
jgi:hypothetical protein